MGRNKDTNLTEIIHLRVTADTKKWYREYAKRFGVSVPDAERWALALFIECGGVDYKEKD